MAYTYTLVVQTQHSSSNSSTPVTCCVLLVTSQTHAHAHQSVLQTSWFHWAMAQYQAAHPEGPLLLMNGTVLSGVVDKDPGAWQVGCVGLNVTRSSTSQDLPLQRLSHQMLQSGAHDVLCWCC